MNSLISPAAQEMFDAHRKNMDDFNAKQIRWAKIDRRVRNVLNIGIVTTGIATIVCNNPNK